MLVVVIWFFKQKTAYEMRISDWSSDVCSSDLAEHAAGPVDQRARHGRALAFAARQLAGLVLQSMAEADRFEQLARGLARIVYGRAAQHHRQHHRSEEHTSELQSLMRISYAVFCLKKKKQPTPKHVYTIGQ